MQETHSILVGVDWYGLLWASGLAALVSWANTRIAVKVGQPRTWADVLADVVIGTTAGMGLALAAPIWWPSLHNFGAVTALACVGGIGGRKIYDLALSGLLYVGRLRLGVKDKDGDGGEGSGPKA